MNLLLIHRDELIGAQARIVGARARDVQVRHELREGITLRCGVRDGELGRGTVVASGEEIVLSLSFGEVAPPRTPIRLIVAVPRPPAIAKILSFATVAGISGVTFLRSANVEKSYLHSHALRAEEIDIALELALEQAQDTVAPIVEVADRFKPFVEDVLAPALRVKETRGFFCDERCAERLEEVVAPPQCESVRGGVLVIGPELGWNDFERNLLAEAGCVGISLGPRTLRVDQAAAVSVAELGLLIRSCSSCASQSLPS